MSKKSLSLLISGGLLLTIFIVLALFPQWFTPYGLKERFEVYLSPSSTHILGTNDVGYDVFTELVYSTRQSLIVGVLASLFSLILGVLFGVLFSLNKYLRYIGDVLGNTFLALPRLIVIMVLVAFLNRNMWNIILVISLFTWQGTAKLVTNRIDHIKAEPYYAAGKMMGYSDFHMAIYHIIPNLKDIIITRFLLGVSSCVILESTISFLGLGDLYNVSWGTMMNFAYSRGAMLRKAFAYLLSPGFMIMLLSLSFYLIYQSFQVRKEEITDTRL